MASACVNNIGMSPAAKTYPSYGWLSPRISFSREEDHRHHHPQSKPAAAAPPSAEGSDGPDPAEPQDPVDFEFRLDDPVTMLPADELFSDGKLVPLHINAPPPNVSTAPKPSAVNGLTGTRTPTAAGVRSPEQEQQQQPNRSCRRMELEISGTDAYLFSPKAPRCSSRWKELLGLKKLYQNPSNTAQKPDKTTSSSSSSTTTHTAGTSTTNPKSLKHFLHRSSKPCSCSVSLDHTLSLPLLKDSDYLDSVSISSSRLSLSSSSSSHDHEDLPRLSLDAAEKPSSTTATTTTTAAQTHHPNPNPFVLNRAAAVASRVRMVKARSSSACESNGNGGGRVGRSPMRREEATAGESCSRGVSVDSPRMNSSGKIVFQSLERSSSSPSTFNGGPRLKHRGMERSYSANVRVTPVLNVPVCSLRGSSKSFGFGQLFSSSPQKREGINNNKGQHHHNHHHHHHHHHHHQLQQQQSNSSRNRTDRT